MIKKQSNKKIAVTQILLLVIGIFAISWMVGSSVGEVSAVDEGGNILPNLGGTCGVGGTCINTTTTTCNGEIKVGLCSGSAEIRCCDPIQETPNSESNKKFDVGTAATSISAIGGLLSIRKEVSGLLSSKASPAATETAKVVAESASATATEATGGITSTGTSGVKSFTEILPTQSATLAQPAELSFGQQFFGYQAISAETGEASWTGVGGGTAEAGGSLGTAIFSIAAWSAFAFIIGRYVIGPLLGLNTQNAQALGWALAAGTAAGLIATSETILGASALGGPVGLIIGVVVAAVTFLILAKRSAVDVVSFSCYSWDAPTGGQKCELCNKQDIECTEYQCKSLGQGCEFSIDETTGQALCEWSNQNDILAPVISPREESLLNSNFEYTPDNAMSPPDKGVKIEYINSNDGCAPAWTPVKFGIKVNERARCKFNPVMYASYEEMPDIFFSNGARVYNHTYGLVLPTAAALASENITVENGGVYQYFIRCEDSNGNSNSANFGIKFCIQEGPDKSAPIIDHASPLDGSPFANGEKSIDADLFINEPSICKWSSEDKDYELMENEMTCATSASQMNAQNLFKCSTTLTGLKDNQKNKFYFRCKDQPYLAGSSENLRNTNKQSYVYTLVGTEELVIDWAKPNNTIIKDSTTPVPVKIEVQTSLGYNEGKAVCSISPTGKSGSFVNFYYGSGVDLYSQYKHSQVLNLNEGDQKYYIRCCDLGNNCDNTTVNFKIETDLVAPNVVRVYKEENNLKVATDENATCVYSTFGCSYNFESDGTKMSTLNGKENTEHYTSWPGNSQTVYYIKCQDTFGNRPISSQCSVIVRPFEIPELKNN